MRSVLLYLLFPALVAKGQNDSIPYKKRKIILGATTGAIAAGSLIYLNQAWYQEYNTGDFHFFDDNPEWLQMDKAGHAFTTYQAGRLMMQACDWAGFSKKEKLIYGAGSGLLYMTAVECLDGFSDGWGFSWGDEAANVAGSTLAAGQEIAWNEQRVQIKFSYAPSGLARHNPRLLGEDMSTQILKDYNGQTYWLSITPGAFMKKERKFPKWLAFSIGYGAYGMLGGRSNNVIVQDENGTVYHYDRERRYYLSIDLDLTRIKTKSKFLKSLFSAMNMIKFPAPALQFSNKGIRAHYLRF